MALEEGVRGRKNDKKKLVVFAIERKGKGVSRVYGKVIAKSSAKELGTFMKAAIDADTPIKTDKWTGYTPLKKDFVFLTTYCGEWSRKNRYHSSISFQESPPLSTEAIAINTMSSKR